MVLLTAEQIRQANDLPFEDVPVPEWGGVVRVRCMSGKARNDYETALERDKEGSPVIQNDVRTILSAASMVDDKGDQLFSAKEVKDLAAKSWTALQRVFEAALRLNGMSSKEASADQKNLPEEPGQGSSSS
jgi:hypothetical protein